MSNLYLSEEMHNEAKNKLKYISLIILIIGIIGGSLFLYKGISIKTVNNKTLSIQIKQELKQNGYSKKYYELKNEIKKVNFKNFCIIYGFLTTLVFGITSVAILKISKDKEAMVYGEKQTIPSIQDEIKTMLSVTKESNEIVDDRKKY